MLVDGICHCGRPLHYRDPKTQATVEELVRQHGRYIRVTTSKGSWFVDRHYIALHGIFEHTLPDLGFAEAAEESE